MAQATKTIIREPVEKEDGRRELEAALDQNAEGVAQTLALLQQLQERGVLPLLSALVEQGDDVLKVLLALVKREEYLGGVKNLIAIVQLLTAIPPQTMESMVHGMKSGVHEASQSKPREDMGIYDLLQGIRDPDVSRAISYGLSFLKGMGKQLGESELGEKLV